MKMKNIFTLILSALMMVSCGGGGDNFCCKIVKKNQYL